MKYIALITLLISFLMPATALADMGRVSKSDKTHYSLDPSGQGGLE